ncbi:MAG: EamA family transporter [Gemmatimonadota bacterium]|nr:EamA family transporter [Gemmatimonadota bacterium]
MSAELKKARRLHILIAFASIYTIWGSTYLAIRYADQSLPPFLMAGVRFLISGGILYALSRHRGSPRPPRLHWRNALIAGAFLLVGGNGAVVWAEQTVPSGLTALLVSVLPFWLVLIDWVRPNGNRPRPMVIAGLILGIVGIFVLVNPTASNGNTAINLVGAVVLIFGSLSWALGSFYSRDADLPASGIMRTALEMIGGGALLLILSLAVGEPQHFDVQRVTSASWLGLAYLITFGLLIGFTSYIWLLDKVSPALVGTYAFVNPVVAVFLGWAFASEPLSTRTLVAAAIVIGAVALITMARGGPPAEPDCS